MNIKLLFTLTSKYLQSNFYLIQIQTNQIGELGDVDGPDLVFHLAHPA